LHHANHERSNKLRRDEVVSLREAVYARFGEIGLFMNNAATRVGGGVLGDIEDWQRALDVNFWGVVHGVSAFVPRMLEQGSPALVIDTAPSRGSPTGPATWPTT
jgi:NAD(P)-dependent dehydrogenase (short-subunit alcohol dehydrogenase family)